MEPFRISLAKETFKFSATHFTIFGAESAEHLHGHNYIVSFACGVSALDDEGMAFEFNTVKPILKCLTEIRDESILMPANSRHLQFQKELVRGVSHIVVNYRDRSYRFPENEVQMLPVANITSEELARLFALEMAQAWKEVAQAGSESVNGKVFADLAKRISWLEISIEESSGQRASFRIESPLTASGVKS